MNIYYKQAKKPIKLPLLGKAELYEITDIQLSVPQKSALITQPNSH